MRTSALFGTNKLRFFLKFMMCPHGQGGGEPVRTFLKGEESILCGRLSQTTPCSFKSKEEWPTSKCYW